MKEYLRTLPPYKGMPVEDSIQSGDVVLIQDEAFPRLQWPLGIIQQVYPGRDGHIPFAQVKTAKGVLVRPIQRIHQLEICDRITDCLPVILSV